MDKMKNANTTWYEEDVVAILEGNGIEPTEENINKVITPEFINGFRNCVVEYGNEIIERHVNEVFI